MPGLGRMHPRQMNQLMKRYGLSVDELKDVEEIIIKTSDKDYVFKSPVVTIMDVKGQKTYQITGEPEIVEKGAVDGEQKASIPQEDIDLVVAQTNATDDEARKALEDCNGNPAEAILKLLDAKK